MTDTRVEASRGTLQEAREAAARARAAVAAAPDDTTAAEELHVAVRVVVAARRAGQESPRRGVAPAVAEAARLLDRGEAESAELLLRRYLATTRNDADAMLLMANIAAQHGFPDNAEKILRRSIEVDPGAIDNHLALAQVLHNRARAEDRPDRIDDALAALEAALRIAPDEHAALLRKAELLVQVRRLDAGLAAFDALLAHYQEDQPGWTNYAHLLKTLGRFGEAVAAYRTAIAIDPNVANTWWLFADLKLGRFFPGDIARMTAALAQPRADLEQASLHFALAAALDKAKDFEAAAVHFRDGNALRLSARPHDMVAMREGIDRAIATYTAPFFAARRGWGASADDPIFVVGLPRSGSTLVEQILSSHSRVEGTSELFAVQQLEVELFAHHQVEAMEPLVERLDQAELTRLGERYIALTRYHRSTGRPHFIDKNPGNWRQAGFIHAMLPNARIVDVRRNPLDCCFANYTQHFMVGVNYSYGIAEVASQYREYLRFMRHLDEALPGRVTRVIYEDLVDDLSGEVRRLLAALDLPFEDACLRFHETERAVHTPSSEQVRQPINRAGVGKWLRYEPWFGELRDELGEAVENWRL